MTALPGCAPALTQTETNMIVAHKRRRPEFEERG